MLGTQGVVVLKGLGFGAQGLGSRALKYLLYYRDFGTQVYNKLRTWTLRVLLGGSRVLNDRVWGLGFRVIGFRI